MRWAGATRWLAEAQESAENESENVNQEMRVKIGDSESWWRKYKFVSE